MRTRRSKRKQPADPASRSEEDPPEPKAQKKKKSKKEDSPKKPLPPGATITGGKRKLMSVPSAQSISSAKNRDKELDLDVSYVGKIKLPPKPPKPPRHRRWKHKGKESMEDPTKLPDDWAESEPDLSDDDYDAQIARCEERIKDNIMVSRFKVKLEYLKADKAQKDFRIDSEPFGLDWPVIQRLNVLKKMEEELSKNDPYQQLETVRAIMRAYRYHELDWNPGLVTYWAGDRQLCQPRPFKWDEMDQVKEKQAKGKSFWVEGGSDPRPAPMAASVALPPDQVRMHYSVFAFRFTDQPVYANLEMMDDTGASHCTLYEDDVKNMLHPRPSTIPVERFMGRTAMLTSNGEVSLPVVKLEICLVHQSGVIIPWTPLQCTVFPGRHCREDCDRLLGPVLRHLAFTATAPDNRNELIVSNNRDDLIRMLPDPNVALAFLPELPMSPYLPASLTPGAPAP